MALWLRLTITFAAMLLVSFLAGLICNRLGFALPSYAAGIIGGMTAVPVWEFSKRIQIKDRTE